MNKIGIGLFISFVISLLFFNGHEVSSDLRASTLIVKKSEVDNISSKVELKKKSGFIVLRKSIFTTTVNSTENDAQESSEGRVNTKSGNIYLAEYCGIPQIAGIRFEEVMVPRGATIKRAYIQFVANSSSDDSSSLTINIENHPEPSEFKEEYFDLSDRKVLDKKVVWKPKFWEVLGENSSQYSTADLSQLIIGIVSQEEWKSGNPMVFLISGEGCKIAKSFDANPQYAPKLYIEYEAPY
jgi:hypothetical protein